LKTRRPPQQHILRQQQETTRLLSELLLKVTVTSYRYYIKMLNVSALLLDDALKPATQLANGAMIPINENQLIFDEVKAYKNYAKFFVPPFCNTCKM